MPKRHLIAILALSFALSVSLAACGSAAAPASPQPTLAPAKPPEAQAAPTPVQSAQAFPITIKDDAGRDVTIQKAPQRIVSLSSANTEALFALGLEGRTVGVDDYSNYPAAAKSKPHVGGFSKPDLEKIVALEPDLVLGAPIHVKATLPEMERRNLTTVIIDPKDVRAVLERIQLVGKIAGQQKEADALATSMQARIDKVQQKIKGAAPVRVFYEISPQLHTAGGGTFVDDVIRLSGGTNIAASAGKDWPQLSQEALIVADPEVILLADQPANVTPEAVAARPAWGSVSAVQNKRVTVINDELTSRAGPRVVDGLEMVAGLLHPDRTR